MTCAKWWRTEEVLCICFPHFGLTKNLMNLKFIQNRKPSPHRPVDQIRTLEWIGVGTGNPSHPMRSASYSHDQKTPRWIWREAWTEIVGNPRGRRVGGGLVGASSGRAGRTMDRARGTAGVTKRSHCPLKKKTLGPIHLKKFEEKNINKNQTWDHLLPKSLQIRNLYFVCCPYSRLTSVDYHIELEMLSENQSHIDPTILSDDALHFEWEQKREFFSSQILMNGTKRQCIAKNFAYNKSH